MNIAEMAESAYRAWQYAARIPESPSWELLSDNVRHAFGQAAHFATSSLDTMDGRTWGEMVAFIYRLYVEAKAEVGVTVPALEDAPERERLAWEAATRHLFHLADAGDEDEAELPQLEQRWSGWADRRLQAALEMKYAGSNG